MVALKAAQMVVWMVGPLVDPLAVSRAVEKVVRTVD
jgi:hypothetical protein